MKINYDLVSKVYDKVRIGDPIIIDKIINRCIINKDTKILDIGCGTGNNTVLIENVTNADIYGIDQSVGMVSKAKGKSSNVEWIIDDAVTLSSISDQEFNIVFMVDVIHHIRDINTMFKNIYRILKKNGKIFIFTDSHEHIKNNRLTSKYFPKTIENELQRYQSTKNIVSSLKSNFFDEIHWEDICYPLQESPGEKLIKLAKVKGYSMFHLISQKDIDAGIKKLEHDMSNKEITYTPKTQMIFARK